jgi:hypothetical protein
MWIYKMACEHSATPYQTILRTLATGFTALVVTATAASATTTVNWTGSDNFNDTQIIFSGFQANQLDDISGSGLYEACCHTGATSFTLQIDLNNHWIPLLQWSSTGDNVTHSLGDLVPPAISFTEGWVTGIKLTSSPNGEYNDPNFTDFNFVTYLSQQDYYNLHKSEYNSWNDFIQCGDYDRYIQNTESFVFSDNVTGNGPPPGTTPLPGALPLLASGASLIGALGWRRKRKAQNR